MCDARLHILNICVAPRPRVPAAFLLFLLGLALDPRQPDPSPGQKEGKRNFQHDEKLKKFENRHNGHAHKHPQIPPKRAEEREEGDPLRPRRHLLVKRLKVYLDHCIVGLDVSLRLRLCEAVHCVGAGGTPRLPPARAFLCLCCALECRERQLFDSEKLCGCERELIQGGACNRHPPLVALCRAVGAEGLHAPPLVLRLSRHALAV
mmetsp:Transcript_4191/g.9520  ORF Transcript_4191/g.9520 Transcript_4191/m.9520 type:complete len:206 (-) Transcript_4191:650-1267(-)